MLAYMEHHLDGRFSILVEHLLSCQLGQLMADDALDAALLVSKYLDFSTRHSPSHITRLDHSRILVSLTQDIFRSDMSGSSVRHLQ